ncbi:c-type cytochrome biogenesis protein CcmI [Paracoccus contaminans]|uniref:C-type cytochrome biogenesis protein CcmI n=1 Tax=Paracoccus contaminans TaxID=1945662 RepID=A0A1W6CV90_9RHOB|nr:c-type cytochrome biogenesis protein CcmI [Paracoccus contaminans]ARJ68764.1 c-type cytochrome biogenesis protein CcmI [Paracoccus contaminans]
MFWIMAGAMMVLVGGAILLPFMRRGAAPALSPAAFDLRVYREQLREVDRDIARGVLAPDDAARLRTEIGRKVLEADRALTRQAAPDHRAPRAAIAAAALAALLAGSVGVYARLGSPSMPDLPLAERIAAADRRMAARPLQAEAEAAAPARPRPQPPEDYARLVQQLRDAVARRPGDAQGLALLAEHEARLGNLVAARQAQESLLSARGKDATAEDHARLAGLMIEAAGGAVSREAEAQLGTALKLDPQNGQAHYLQGLMLAQGDRPDLAFAIWRRLAETSRPDDPWMEPLRRLLPDLAWLAGHPDYQLPGGNAPPLPGPDAADMAAAAAMTPEQRQQMIRGMVTQLETRLADQGGAPEEWARLITALARLGDTAHAQEIWTEAQGRFAGRPEALAAIAGAGAEAGLTGTAAP